jgi:predicted Fe-Mo cluster-binding NifX family protein
MKIAIPSEGQTITSVISSTLGRAPFLIIYDDQTMEFQSVANAGFTVQDGSGIQATDLIIKNKVDVLLTQEIGRKAYSVLMKEHLEIHLLKSGGTVKSVLNKYLKKKGD